MCEYCNDDYVQPLINQDIVLTWNCHTTGNGINMNLEMKRKINVLTYIDESGGKCKIHEDKETRSSIPLNYRYCPMCGRQLTGKGEDDE